MYSLLRVSLYIIILYFVYYVLCTITICIKVYVSYIAGQTAQKNWLKYFRKPVSILGSGGNIDLKIRNIFSSN